MADWYVSSAAYALIVQFAASTAYTVGQIVRPLTTPAFNAECAFRCTTAGTSSTEPSWPGTNNSTVTTGGATFTNVTGQSTYGWSACAGTVFTMGNNGTGGQRINIGDRLFVSSDHTETYTGSSSYTFVGSAGYGVIEIISVNRAGNVPPQATDQLAGAKIIASTSDLALDPVCSTYWQGITFSTANNLRFSQNAAYCKRVYLRNCAIVLTGTGGNTIFCNGASCGAVLDNTTVQFGATSQSFGVYNYNYNYDLLWINTPSAIQGSNIPTDLISATNQSMMAMTFRGVDLSALNTNLISTNQAPSKLLLDSCKISPSLTRALPSSSSNSASDEVELVNCFDGTNFLSERHTDAGDLTTDRSTTMTGGAQDDNGSYAHKLISSSRNDDWSMTLDSFWLDVENTLVGAAHTATVEIISSGTLNNTDISLSLQYLGTSGSSLASFASSLPSALTASAALPTSSATWNNPPSTPVAQHIQVSFTPQKAGRLRGLVRLGKPSTTVWVNPQIAVT